MVQVASGCYLSERVGRRVEMAKAGDDVILAGEINGELLYGHGVFLRLNFLFNAFILPCKDTTVFIIKGVRAARTRRRGVN